MVVKLFLLQKLLLLHKRGFTSRSALFSMLWPRFQVWDTRIRHLGGKFRENQLFRSKIINFGVQRLKFRRIDPRSFKYVAFLNCFFVGGVESLAHYWGSLEEEHWLKKKGAHILKACSRETKGTYNEHPGETRENKGLLFLVLNFLIILFGHHSLPRVLIGTRIGGNGSYQPPGPP